MNLNTKKVILIIGPTAIGKTRLSIDLAKVLNTEIISCDSRQFYKELKIGTAPPNKKELSEIRHHFIHNLSILEDYNCGQYEHDVIKKINTLHETNDIIIITGGSGLYIDAICKGFDLLPKITNQTRKKTNIKYKKNGLLWLQNKVNNIDPETYSKIDKKNPKRLLRVLEIFEETGKKFSLFQSKKTKERPFKIIKIGLNIERKKLYNRINKRVDIMMEKGLLQEAISLIEYQHKNSLQTVGYKEIFTFLNKECTLKEAVENIKKNTRRLAKRQLTWFRKDKKIKWYEPNQLEEIKEFILKL
tara:strand:+ start:12917 stop:13822 length:906 start_codon:yes stop_codon:yes gene_type:complete